MGFEAEALRAPEPEKKQLTKKLPSTEQREKQINIVRLWRALGIKMKPQENNDRVIFSEEDLAEYHRRKAQHKGFGMYATEGSAFAEYMLLEGADAEGVTEAHASWFGDRVQAYEPSDYDDVLNGADAILLFLDEADERIGYPIVVDVATKIEDAKAKQLKDFRHFTQLDSSKLFSHIYWYDTKAKEAGDYFDEPREGKIPAINLSVYIPAELGTDFANERVSLDQTTRDMRELGPFILRQMQIELELQAALLLNKVQLESLASGKIRIHDLQTREDLLQMLEAAQAERNTDQHRRRALVVITQVLKNLWEAQAEQIAKGLTLNRSQLKVLRALRPAKNFDGFPTE